MTAANYNSIKFHVYSDCTNIQGNLLKNASAYVLIYANRASAYALIYIYMYIATAQIHKLHKLYKYRQLNIYQHGVGAYTVLV